MGFKRINPYSPVFSRGKSGRKWLRFAQVFQLLKGPTGCGCSGWGASKSTNDSEKTLVSDSCEGFNQVVSLEAS